MQLGFVPQSRACWFNWIPAGMTAVHGICVMNYVQINSKIYSQVSGKVKFELAILQFTRE